MSDQFLKIGKVVATFSLDGTIKVVNSSSFINERYKKGNTIYYYKNNEYIPINIIKTRINKDLIFLKLENVDTVDKALELKGLELFALKDNSLLKDNEYYFDDLNGCDVFLLNGEKLGKVIEVCDFPSCVSLRVEVKGKNILIPFIDEIIKNVDIANKSISIEPMAGLL